MVANCLEKISTSSTLGFFLPPKNEKPFDFFFSPDFFFFDLMILVMIIFFSFNK